MKLDTSKKILIVGLGLLGGSYARALTKKGYYVTAITRSQSSIDYALSEKLDTCVYQSPEPIIIIPILKETCSGVSYIFLRL